MSFRYVDARSVPSQCRIPGPNATHRARHAYEGRTFHWTFIVGHLARLGSRNAMDANRNMTQRKWVEVILQKLVAGGDRPRARRTAPQVRLARVPAAGCVLVGSVAGALAADVLKSAVAALPANMFSIWMNFSGSVLANYWSRRPVGTAKEGV